jgi:hypothetical protein
MSFTDTRVLLATALDSVTGLVGHQFRPAVVKAGSAWPTLDTINRGPGDAWSATWAVTVVLGGEEQAAANLLDDVFPELVDELEANGIAYVEGAAGPAPYPIGGTTMHAATLRVTSE